MNMDYMAFKLLSKESQEEYLRNTTKRTEQNKVAMMEKVLLNSDLLNDTESIYFQIDRLTFIRIPAVETGDFLTFFSDCFKQLKMEGIKHQALFIPFNIYNNTICLMRDYPLGNFGTDTLEQVLWKSGMNAKNIVVYIPDCLKDQCKI